MTLTSSYLSGGVFSYDGVHPSATGYAIVADALVQFVNASYGTTIPRVDMSPYLFNGNSSGGFPTQLVRPAEPGADRRVRRGVFHAGGPRELLADDGRSTEDKGIALGDGDDELPVPVAPRRAAVTLAD